MDKSSTNLFIPEIPLIIDSKQEKKLLSRFKAWRQVYSAFVNTGIVKLELVRKSETYQKVKKVHTSNQKQRHPGFTEGIKNYRYSLDNGNFSAPQVAKIYHWITEKVHAQAVPKLGTRGFNARERILFTKAEKNGVQVPSRFRSIEPKTNKQGIRWANNQLVCLKLKLNAKTEADQPVIQHRLSLWIKYLRKKN